MRQENTDRSDKLPSQTYSSLQRSWGNRKVLDLVSSGQSLYQGREQASESYHLVPVTIGETNIAYLFGMKFDDGFDYLWFEKNGLLLHYAVKEALDNAQLGIVPHVDNSDILRVVLLDPSIANELAYEKSR